MPRVSRTIEDSYQELQNEPPPFMYQANHTQVCKMAILTRPDAEAGHDGIFGELAKYIVGVN